MKSLITDKYFFMRRMRKESRIAMFVVFGIAAFILFGFLIMLLWNNVLAQVVHVGLINFWQAIGLLILSKILFGGFRGAQHGKNHYWRRRMLRRWQNMTPEEREKFQEEWRSRCGGGPMTEEEKPASEPGG
jgi:hypothetical protein